VIQFSEEMARFAPHLTLDIVTEFCGKMIEEPISTRLSSLQALSSWVQNLVLYTDPTHELFEVSGARLRDAVRCLVDLTTADQEVCTSAFSSATCLTLPSYTF
jgi:hypothetical protein